MTDQKGQTLIEALMILPVLMIFLLGVLCVSYSIYSREVSSFILYRSLVCTEELNKERETCFKSAEKRLKKILFFHKNIHLSKKMNNNNREVKITASFFTFKTKYKRSLKVSFQ